VENIETCLATLLKQYANEERVNVPLMKSIAHLLSHDCFSTDRYEQFILYLFSSHSFSENVLQSIREQLTVTKNVQKIFYMVDACCEILKFEEPTRSSAMGLILGNLMSPYPKVREHSSTQLYSILQVSYHCIIN
jgi:hypothetical protein